MSNRKAVGKRGSEASESSVSDFQDEHPRYIDEKTAPLLFELLKTEDIRKVANSRGIRKTIWQKFWDRMFETEEYTTSRTRAAGGDSDQQQRDLNTVNLSNRLEPRKKQLEALPPYLLEYDGSMWERHQENQLILAAVGREAYEAACAEEDKTAPFYATLSTLKLYCIEHLAGVDVYWDSDVEDKPTSKDNAGYYYRKMRPNISKSKWGTLKICPFPFTALFRYDDCDDYVIFSTVPIVAGTRRLPKDALVQLEDFVAKNKEPQIMQIREMRQKLRSLDDLDIHVDVLMPTKREVRAVFHMMVQGEAQLEEQQVPPPSERPKDIKAILRKHKDDVEAEKDKDTKQKVNVRATVSVNLAEMGDLWEHPITKEIVPLAPGFHFKITTKKTQSQASRCAAFVCGDPEVGVHPDNFVKQNDDSEDKEFTLSKLALGMKRDWFDYTEPIYKKLTSDQNLNRKSVEYLKALYQTYRDYMNDEYNWKKKVVSYEFGLYVYDTDKISRDELENTLIAYEDKDSPLIRDLVRGFQGNHIIHLEDLYDRLRDFDTSLMTTCWYLFWLAIEDHNRASGYELIQLSVQRLIDPSEPGSIFGREMSRKDLTAFLADNGVYSPDGNGVINDPLLEQLYSKLASLRRDTVLELDKKLQNMSLDTSRRQSIGDGLAGSRRQSLAAHSQGDTLSPRSEAGTEKGTPGGKISPKQVSYQDDIVDDKKKLIDVVKVPNRTEKSSSCRGCGKGACIIQ